jgi:hypothetical protein
MNTYQEIAAAPAQLALPEWLQELRTGLAVRSQFAVSGNIRDLFPVHGGDGPAFLPAGEAIWSVLKQRGYACLLKYDPVAGTRLHHECDDELLPLLRDAGIDLDTPPRDLEALAEQLRLVASNKRMPIAFLLDYASQLCGPSHELDSAQRDFFIACDKIAHAAAPLRASERPADLPYNPIIWLIDRPNDLPGWFAVGNETIRSPSQSRGAFCLGADNLAGVFRYREPVRRGMQTGSGATRARERWHDAAQHPGNLGACAC